jgi:hypothetical protein
MSTLKADTLVAADGTSPVTLTKQSAAKAWQSNVLTSLDDSFNISSVTDVDTGKHRYSYVNNMSDGNYAWNSSGQDMGATALITYIASRAQITTSYHEIWYGYVSNFTGGFTRDDIDYGTSVVHGDLA